MKEQSNPLQAASPRRRSIWLPVLGAGVIAIGGATVYQSTQTEDLRRQFAASQRDNNALRAKLSETDSELQSALKSLRDELAETRLANTADVAQARTAASIHADIVANRIAQIQQQQAQRMTEELGKVKESTQEAYTRLDGITSDFGSVRTDVASARSDLQETRSDLQRSRGDLGMMSGLIATNAREVQVLKDLGDRNIFQFSLNKGAALQRVGDIQVALKKVDAKRNRYTLAVMADDKLVEKKDRAINEPVQFYTAKVHQPYELVVNEVRKDKVVGYLATPKLVFSRTTAGLQ